MSPTSSANNGSDVARALVLVDELHKDVDDLKLWKDALEDRYRNDRQWANDEHSQIKALIAETKDALVEMIANLKDAMHTMERALYLLIFTSVLLPIVFLVIAHYIWH